MTTPTYDRDFWEQLWARTLRERADGVARRPPNAHLTREVSGLKPGRALDAGCGHGSEALWLAAHGWQVTAVDFSAAALAHARSTAEAAGADLVGHRPIDPATGATTPAAGQQQVSVQAMLAALDPHQWKVVVAEDRPRTAAGTGVDALTRAWRLS